MEAEAIHESQPGQRGRAPGQTEERARSSDRHRWPVGTDRCSKAGSRGRRAGERFLAHTLRKRLPAAFCVSRHTCQHRGPRPPGREISRPTHWDLGTDACEVLPTPLSPCETPVSSAGAKAGGEPWRPGQHWLCQAEGPMQHGWSGWLPLDRHPGEAAALE